MTEGSKKIQSFLRFLHKVEDCFVGGILLILVFFSFIQLVLKNLPTEVTLWHSRYTVLPFKWLIDNIGTGFAWGDAFLRQLILWLAVLGAAVATRQDRHINIEIASKFLPKNWKTKIRIFTDAFTSVVCGLVVYSGVELVKSEIGAGSIAFANVPAWVMEMIIPIGFGIICLRYLRYFALHVLQALGVMPLPPGDNAPSPKEVA